MPANVGFWHVADIQLSAGNVRLWGQSEYRLDVRRCLLFGGEADIDA
jgi:hypothetical protein